jgi:N-formylglutamate amidohydrolase
MYSVRHIISGQTQTVPGAWSVIERDVPLIVSVPHSGQYVLEQFHERFKYGPGFWVDVEFYTDEVYPTALGSTLVATLAPQQVNFNRSWEHWQTTGERDPIDMLSLLEGEQILLCPYSKAERIFLHEIWQSYHQELDRLIQITRERHGYALVIDCHALNSRALANVPDAGKSGERADFVIGSLDDTSAHLTLIQSFEQALIDATVGKELTVVRNDPYKGGYITQAHHDPHNHVHVLQLEIKKAMYTHEGLAGEAESFQRKPTLPSVAKILHTAFAQVLNDSRSLAKVL